MSKGKTVADFRAAHDPSVIVPSKIKAALASMLKEGPEHWEYENDLIKRAGIAVSQLSAYRDQFADHIIVAPAVHGKNARNVWFADPKVAKKLRG